MNEKEPFDFGERLKMFREELGYSRAEIAKKLNISESSIKRYENNTQLPPVDTLEELAILYRTSLDYLRNFTDRKYIYIDELSPTNQDVVLATLNVLIDKLKNKD